MMDLLHLKNSLPALLLFGIFLTLNACAQNKPQTLITIADARNNPAYLVDAGDPGDSLGDILVFDQPLLDINMDVIGSNSGDCVRTRVAHSYQCQWTLTFNNKSKRIDSIQVAGREHDQGDSNIAIVGGTGRYIGITGEMKSTNNEDGTFTQVLTYRLSD